MASTNQSPAYQKAEGNFLAAKDDETRLFYLEEMIRECPKHKSSEKMLAQLKTRLKKLREKIDKTKKSSKSSRGKGIKKEEMQAVLIGFTNSGKSSLLQLLTNATPEIASYEFTTKKPLIGMINYRGANIQLIEIPAINSEYYDRGLVNTADVILILVNSIEHIGEIEKILNRARGKRLIVFNTQNSEDERKISATLQSKRYNFVVVSAKTGKNIEELKDRLFFSFGKIRIYVKEPGKEKSEKPLILNGGVSVKGVGEKILRNINFIKETKIWGPSSKFSGQKVGLSHILKDLDVVEFKTK